VRIPAPTYYTDIGPIIWKRCTGCHRPGQLAPFSLLEYADVTRHATQIARVTRERVMPPWLPEPGYGDFSNERRLSETEIARIAAWVAGGLAEGEVSERRPPPVYTDLWQLGQPDLVVELPEPYWLRPGKTDVFRNFVLPIPTVSLRYVRAIELRPGNEHVVHHATIGIDHTRESRLLDDADPEPGYEGMFSEGAHSPESHALGWTPGMLPALEPPDMAWRLEPGSDLVIQLHMMPEHLDAPEAVKPSVGFFFTDVPPSRFPMDFKLGSKTIDIPPGQADYVVEDSYVLPVDVFVLSIYPHAHYLGRDLKAFAALPDGTTKWLIWIRHWNFNWQDRYRYASPVFLPRGTKLIMRYSYDNSAGNSQNPHRPPERVVYGPQSSDEMGDLWLRLLPPSLEAAAVLARAFVQNEQRKDLTVAMEGVVKHPNDARWHNLLGARELEAGRIEDGVAELLRAAALDATDAEVHNNLGRAMQLAHRPDEAIREYREASRLAPGNDQIHVNLAGALQDRGDLDGAIREYRAAIGINPYAAETHNNLGVALGSRGRIADAIREFRRALDVRRDYVEAQNNLRMAVDLESRARRP
jgi:Flp pilus assembly protein TadD